MKSLSLPKQLNTQILAALHERGFVETKSKSLAQAVQRLSDFYIAFPDSTTPWDEKWAQLAYIGYYLPLNYLRNAFVLEEARRLNFFAGIREVLDIGSGLGASSLALSDAGLLTGIEKLTLIERAPEARDFQEEYFGRFLNVPVERTDSLSNTAFSSQALGVMSYSLTEMLAVPEILEKLSALMIIEPSTQSDGRRLLQVRQDLLDKDFVAWAPCLHQGACPLLTHSKVDWCHHKLKPLLPDWLAGVMKLLPMHTGEVLSLGYLLLKKEAAPQQEGLTRVIGDPLKEKGKTRQLICRSSEREFLSWLRRDHKKPQCFTRHDLIQLSENLSQAGNELRVAKGSSPRKFEDA